MTFDLTILLLCLNTYVEHVYSCTRFDLLNKYSEHIYTCTRMYPLLIRLLVSTNNAFVLNLELHCTLYIFWERCAATYICVFIQTVEYWFWHFQIIWHNTFYVNSSINVVYMFLFFIIWSRINVETLPLWS